MYDWEMLCVYRHYRRERQAEKLSRHARCRGLYRQNQTGEGHFRIKTGKLEWKGNLDMELGMEVIDTSDQYETAILISGDSDFAPVIDRIKRAGKRVIVMSTRGHISKELLDRAKYVDLRKLKQELVLE